MDFCRYPPIEHANYLSFFSLLFSPSQGRPLPQVTWWRDNVLLNSTSIQMSDKKVKNTLQLNRLERKDLHNSYVCQSSNNDVSSPITSSVTLDLNCKCLPSDSHNERARKNSIKVFLRNGNEEERKLICVFCFLLISSLRLYFFSLLN